jgi:hypothetical protein
MILPGLANVPGHTLIPSRRPALSRPLLDEPPAFFVACRTDIICGDDDDGVQLHLEVEATVAVVILRDTNPNIMMIVDVSAESAERGG